ncbi:MAG: ABC-F type ribosomal protection protein [Butyrivibrio sp.]|nr:ABC-F type ribosomal protection protein [Muribaculum sp.]MCM1552713.1 ABC-F type ribosomal protection protein [Butyrivibrio sp.]
MSMINISKLTFAYEGSYDNVFEDVSFQIDTDWKLGFTGRNGRGKTTFLNLLMGKYPYSGTISKNVKTEYFPYPVNDMSQYAIEIMQSICPFAEDWEFLKETSLLDVDSEALYRPFETLSNGERTKVLLVALFLAPNHFLLIDEPTNHLDAESRRKVGEYLQHKKGFILVSHDRELLDACVDHILSINRTNIEIQQGNFSSWWKNKQLQDEFELDQNKKLKKEIGRLAQAAKQTAEWSDKVEKSKKGKTNSGSKIDRGYVGHKSAKMMKRAKSQESRMLTAVSDKSKLLQNLEQSDTLKITMIPYQKDILANAAQISLFYGDTPVCSDITFQIRQGDRILVKGKNGSGKSTLLKLLCGEDIKYSGALEIGSNLKISYVPQDTSFLRGSLSAYAEKSGIDESLFKTVLRKLGFERNQFEKVMEDFSGGQKKKVLIARSLCEQAHLFVWDEPLNFIDVISRIQIEELLLEYQPTMIFVEHDIAFQHNIATSEIYL